MPKHMVNFRISETAKDRLKQLAEQTGQTQTAALEELLKGANSNNIAQTHKEAPKTKQTNENLNFEHKFASALHSALHNNKVQSIGIELHRRPRYGKE